ncbi:MAG: 23S rRNA (adenine(2503)-C(2))-methyltransferase RlmN [Odoribacteraceae bacterium]|nr:23S rRNA (adenine(2503)-C(2))-methyltransferase RlmN [Odoribacteraceae bacterium]
MEKRDIRELSPAELSAFLQSIGEKPFRAKQIERWLWQKGVTRFEEMRDLPASTRARLQECFPARAGEITAAREGRDGTGKLGVTLPDGSVIETVLIPSGKRVTACVSTQAGCQLRCAFCATGAAGFTRDLDAREIFDQVMMAKRRAEARGARLSNVVFMGMGEPLLNLDNVLAAVDRLTSPAGLAISPARLTLSTAGIPGGIRRLADEKARFHLAISLHSAVNATRDRLMPVNKAYPLDRLADAIAYFVEKTGTRPTLEYLLLEDINDTPEEARALALFCRRFPVKINILEYNPVAGAPYGPTPAGTRDRFIRFLESKNMVVNARRSRGADIAAACGQLANKRGER